MHTEKEIRIRLKSVRYEVEASLFSSAIDAIEAEEYPFVENHRDGEPEIIEINSIGRQSDSEGRIQISYDETEVTGMDGSTTAVSFMREQPKVVSMIREGAVSTALVFEVGKRHHCVYHTPFMPFEVCVHTLKVENRLLEEGYLDLDYVIEIRGAQAERTKFRMEILK